jgi:hypothetical protein
MLDKFTAENYVDENGNPSGGIVAGVGLNIYWQNGPLGRGEDRKAPNGAFVETVVAAAVERLKFYQEASDGKFACEANKLAIDCFNAGLEILEARTREREARQVEGTHVA